MISKLTQLKDPQEQSIYLSQLLQKSSKNCKQFVNELNQQLITKLQQIVSKQNFSLWLQFILTLLSHQECFQYANSGNSTTTPLLKLFDYCGTLDVDDKYQKVSQLVVKYPNIQNSVALHALYAKHCVTNVKQTKLSTLLATFIRLCSFIIQKYLQLKNQPANGADDRIQGDKIILKNCQKWVSENIKLFFNQFPGAKDQSIKQLILMGVSDMIGALLQTNRQNILDKQLTQNLLSNILLSYIRKNYSLTQIKTHFLRSLRYKNYNNPIKKIQIPIQYTQFHVLNIGLNTQAYSYITIKLIQQRLSSICSNEYLLQYLIPSISQLLIRPYSIKIEGLYLLQKIIQNIKQIKIKTGFQYNYPIQLLFFYLYQYQNQKYQSIRNYFSFQSDQTFISSLIKFNSIHLQNLNKQKQKFIIKTIQKYKLYNNNNNNKIFLLINKINFKDSKTKKQLILLQIIEQLKNKYQKQSMQLIKKWKSYNEGIDSKVLEKLSQL